MTDYARPELGAVATRVLARPVDGRDTSDDTTAEVLDQTASVGPDAAVHQFMFSNRLRQAAIAYVAVTVPLVVVSVWQVSEPSAYLRHMTFASAMYSVPGLIIAAVAARRSDARDRVARWMWVGCFAGGIAFSLSAVPRINPAMNPHVLRTSVPVAMALVVLVVANTLTMRSRSGHRAALVDAVDLVMATIALLAPLGLAFGPALAASSRPWFTIAAALWTVVGMHGTLVALTVRARIAPGHRTMADIGVAFGIAVTLSSAFSAMLGAQEFSIPTGPVAGLFALSIGLGVLFFVHAPRVSSPGLERLPPAAQVRRNSIIALVILATVPVVAGVVWYQRNHTWVPELGLLTVLVLVALSSLRHLLAARETTRLYDLVEQAAQARSVLLGEVMSHVDGSRHRAAAHLHRQAASLHTAMAAFNSAIDQATESGNPAAVRFAADRLRRDLAQRAERLQRLADAVKPIQPSDDDARRLGAPMRAFLENLAVDGPRPELDLDIDPDLVLDWATETAVLRVVQEATVHAWWANQASHVQVKVTGSLDGVTIEITDDGTGSTEPHILVTGDLGSTARFLGGSITTEVLPEGGTVVRALIPVAQGIPAEPRPHLRLIDPRLAEGVAQLDR